MENISKLLNDINLKRVVIFLGILVLIFLSVFSYIPTNSNTFAAEQDVFYVDPVNGNDENEGSLDKPFLTIIKARDMVRSINGNMKNDIYVYLMSGTFNIEKTIEFESVDSGSNGYNVIYKAYKNSKPVISGGKEIKDWKFDSKNNRYFANITPNWKFRQIYINGIRAVRARTPNLTDEATGAGFNYTLNTAPPFYLNSNEIGSWANSGDVEMVWLASWLNFRARVSNYVNNGGGAVTVNFKEPENSQNPIRNIIQYPTAPYYFENSLALLDAPGEWFLDSKKGILYYKPRTDENMLSASVIAPQDIENLIMLSGKEQKLSVQNIQFSGITFQYTNWLAPNNSGYINGQGGILYFSDKEKQALVPGMIQLNFTKNIRLERNIFQYSGAAAIVETGSADHNSIVGNVITEAAGGGINIVNFQNNADKFDFDTITNNYIYNCGRDYRDAEGIFVTQSKNTTIENNEIFNLPYTGINIGWRWDYKDQGCRNNKVRYNKIHDVMKSLNDGGGIYSLGYMPDTFIEKNYLYNISSATVANSEAYGVYLDNGSKYKTVQNNVLDNVNYAFLVNPFMGPNSEPAINNTVTKNYYNNYELNPNGSVPYPSNIIKNNSKVIGQKWPKEAVDIINASGITKNYIDIIPKQNATQDVNFTDKCLDFSKMLYRSENLNISRLNMNFFENKDGRFKRRTYSESPAQIEYNLPNIKSTIVRVYYYGKQPLLSCQASNDRKKWYDTYRKTSKAVATGGGWNRIDVSFSGFKSNMNYIKIKYPSADYMKEPEIGQIDIIYSLK